MIGLKIKITPKRPKRLTRATKQFKPGMRKASIEVGTMLLKEASARVPVDTGALRRSLEYVVKKFKTGWKLFVGSGVKTGIYLPYALIQDIGGRAGRGGSVVIKGKKYLTGMMQRRRNEIKQIVRKHTRKLFR